MDTVTEETKTEATYQPKFAPREKLFTVDYEGLGRAKDILINKPSGPIMEQDIKALNDQNPRLIDGLGGREAFIAAYEAADRIALKLVTALITAVQEENEQHAGVSDMAFGVALSTFLKSSLLTATTTKALDQFEETIGGSLIQSVDVLKSKLSMQELKSVLAGMGVKMPEPETPVH